MYFATYLFTPFCIKPSFFPFALLVHSLSIHLTLSKEKRNSNNFTGQKLVKEPGVPPYELGVFKGKRLGIPVFMSDPPK